MIKIKYALSFIGCFLFFSVACQEMNGVVVNLMTDEPLEGASVYFNNTTIGTITNSAGEFSIKYYKELRTPLIISFVGFKTAIIVNHFYQEKLRIGLTEWTNELDEVEISIYDDWSRALKLLEFKKHFLGESVRGLDCQILNENDIQLKYDKRVKTLSAKSKVPILVQNNNLKYSISIDLKNFEVEYGFVNKDKTKLKIKYVSYSSVNHYKSISENNNQVREEAYSGSTLHFMRSLADQELEKQGFKLYIGNNRVSSKKYIIVTQDSNVNDIMVKIPIKLKIVFNRKKRSSIKCLKNIFYIDQFGNHYPSETVLFTGDLGNQRMGDNLPLDFKFSER